jgi:hypothetical protein
MSSYCVTEDFEDSVPTKPGKTEQDWQEYYTNLQHELDSWAAKNGKFLPGGTKESSTKLLESCESMVHIGHNED